LQRQHEQVAFVVEQRHLAAVGVGAQGVQPHQAPALLLAAHLQHHLGAPQRRQQAGQRPLPQLELGQLRERSIAADIDRQRERARRASREVDHRDALEDVPDLSRTYP